VPLQSQDAVLPMMYMNDCLEATWQLMMAPREKLTRTTYNVQSMSFSPAQLAAAIQVSQLLMPSTP
jgi:threonine 3-dehydrogenase